MKISQEEYNQMLATWITAVLDLGELSYTMLLCGQDRLNEYNKWLEENELQMENPIQYKHFRQVRDFLVSLDFDA